MLVTHAISRVSIRPSFQGPRRVSSLRAAVSSLGRLACQGRLRLFFSAVCRLVAPPEWLLPCGVPGVSVGGGLSSLGHLVGQGFLRLFLPAASEAHHRSECCLVGVSTFLPRGAVSSFGCLRCQRLSSLFSATYRVKCSTRVEAFFSVPRLPCRGARFLVSVAFVVKGFLPLFTAPTERFHQGMEECCSAPPGSAPRGRIHGPTRRP